ncbi:hypothetical protein GS421_14965 [Rhodococcus hoagii]|nr:hypothetical protein [Prescottella equi]
MLSAGQQALQAAESKLGAPYVYGAAGPDAFDCSGLVQWAYKQAASTFRVRATTRPRPVWSVARDDLQVGDVISFYGGSHSGIYAGNGNVIHASTAGQPVKLAPVSSMPSTALAATRSRHNSSRFSGRVRFRTRPEPYPNAVRTASAVAFATVRRSVLPVGRHGHIPFRTYSRHYGAHRRAVETESRNGVSRSCAR